MSVQERKQRHRAERERLIVTTARAIAGAEGWDAVTTRRLADEIEYSQPVLYSHFSGMAAVKTAVAVEGFAELAQSMRTARMLASDPREALRDVAYAYTTFAASHPAVYDTMFNDPTDLPFASDDAPVPLQRSFAELRDSVHPFAGDDDPDTLAEVVWSSLHGMVTLDRTHRLRPEAHERRLALVLQRFTQDRTST